MQVILKQDVPKLGDAGDLVKVTAGFGRNYLIPRGLAVLATAGSLAQVEHQKKVAEAIRKRHLGEAKTLAEQIEGTAISIRREAGEDDKLFGSVTNRDIAEALAAEGIQIDKRSIQLDEPLKAIGLFTVPVKLHRTVSANLRVYVIRAA